LQRLQLWQRFLKTFYLIEIKEKKRRQTGKNEKKGQKKKRMRKTLPVLPALPGRCQPEGSKLAIKTARVILEE